MSLANGILPYCGSERDHIVMTWSLCVSKDRREFIKVNRAEPVLTTAVAAKAD